MEIIDTYRYLVGGYYGVLLIDEYPIKEFMLEEIKQYINDFINTNDLTNYDLKKEEEIIKDYSDRLKLQDALLLLQLMNGPIDLVLLVKKYLKKLGKKDNFND
jgi:hypothetical protein